MECFLVQRKGLTNFDGIYMSDKFSLDSMNGAPILEVTVDNIEFTDIAIALTLT
jgi:hypothetical protein